MLINVDADNFDQEVLSANGAVLVDFWAEWCGPCRALTPVLNQLNEDMGDNVKIVKVNVDNNNALAQKYNVSSIPNLSIFKNGQIVDCMIGAQPKEVLKNKLLNV